MQKTIASVFWRACDATRPYIPMDRSCGYGCFPFHIDAAEPGKYTTFVVPDMMERQYIIDKRHDDTPVFADDQRGDGGGIANCLVNEWSRHTIGPGGDAGPGIFVCAGPEPTEAELAAALASQIRLCEWKMLMAEDNWTKDKKQLVTEDDREAARWYLAQCEVDGRAIPAAFRNLEWVNVKPGERIETVECPMCFKKVDKRAILCPDGHVIDFGRYQDYLRRKQEAEAMLASLTQAPPPIPMPVVPENPSMPPAA